MKANTNSEEKYISVYVKKEIRNRNLFNRAASINCAMDLNVSMYTVSYACVSVNVSQTSCRAGFFSHYIIFLTFVSYFMQKILINVIFLFIYCHFCAIFFPLFLLLCWNCKYFSLRIYNVNERQIEDGDGGDTEYIDCECGFFRSVFLFNESFSNQRLR